MSFAAFSQTTVRALVALVLVAAVVASPARARAASIDMTAEQFRLYKDYQAALTDARVQKLPDAKRVGAIAKNFHVAEKTLKEAVTKGDALGPSVATQCEAELRTALDTTTLKGRLGDLKVDAADGHVVTYVEWRNDDASKIEEEAATVALMASKNAPITSTVALWAKDVTGRKVFEAKISADAASRFSQDRIAMFARARYIRVFEDVHNAYTGTPPTN
jgi:hypothetical protein